MPDLDIWHELNTSATADKRAIKKAYAARLKHVRPDVDPVGFKRLREAYELALEFAQNNPGFEPGSEQVSEEPSESLGEQTGSTLTVEQLDELIAGGSQEQPDAPLEAHEPTTAPAHEPEKSQNKANEGVTDWGTNDPHVRASLQQLLAALRISESAAINWFYSAIEDKNEWPIDSGLEFETALLNFMARLRPPSMFLTALVVDTFDLHQRFQNERQSSESYEVLEFLIGCADHHKAVLQWVDEAKYPEETKQLFGLFDGELVDGELVDRNSTSALTFMRDFHNEFGATIVAYFREDVLHWREQQKDKQIFADFERRLRSLVLVERHAAEQYLKPDESQFHEFLKDPNQAKAVFRVANKLCEMDTDAFNDWAPDFILTWLKSNSEAELDTKLRAEQRVLQQRKDKEGTPVVLVIVIVMALMGGAKAILRSMDETPQYTPYTPAATPDPAADMLLEELRSPSPGEIPTTISGDLMSYPSELQSWPLVPVEPAAGARVECDSQNNNEDSSDMTLNCTFRDR